MMVHHTIGIIEDDGASHRERSKAAVLVVADARSVVFFELQCREPKQ